MRAIEPSDRAGCIPQRVEMGKRLHKLKHVYETCLFGNYPAKHPRISQKTREISATLEGNHQKLGYVLELNARNHRVLGWVLKPRCFSKSNLYKWCVEMLWDELPDLNHSTPPNHRATRGRLHPRLFGTDPSELTTLKSELPNRFGIWIHSSPLCPHRQAAAVLAQVILLSHSFTVVKLFSSGRSLDLLMAAI